MNDIDFIKTYLPKALFEYYDNAKQICSDLPTQALVLLRSFANELCNVMASENGISLVSKDLNGRIEELKTIKFIEKKTAGLLHDLRVDGNKGAHPEEYKNLSANHFFELAIRNLKKCCELTDIIFGQRVDTPSYEFEQPAGSSIKDLCYRAVMRLDSEAQYLVGGLLKSKGIEERKRAEEEAKTNNSPCYFDEGLRYIEDSKEWFEKAAKYGHARAMFAYGELLIQSSEEETICKGEDFIVSAARNGDSDALVALGSYYLNGSHTIEKDYQLARETLEQAADHDHPSALSNLGAIYHNGLGVEVDAYKAFMYTEKAALAGYPTAQYNLFVFYSKGEVVESDDNKAIEWLKKSYEQEFPEAMTSMAELYLNGIILEKNTQEAYKLFMRAIDKGSTSAMFKCAIACRANCFDQKDHIVQSASLLQHCYEIADEKDPFKGKAHEESPKVTDQLSQYLKDPNLTQDEFNDALMVRWLFDENGYPCSDRKKRTGEIAQNFRKMYENRDKTQGLGKLAPSIFKKSGFPLAEKPQASKKIGRNEPCPCGSGKKYKNCCLQ